MLQTLKENWMTILLTMKEENDYTDVAFNTWIANFKLYSVEGNTVIVLIDKKGIQLEPQYISKKYRMPLIFAITEVIGIDYDVRFIVPDEIPEQIESATAAPAAPVVKSSSNTNPYLNPRYTFDTFVVGKNNDLAHATALAVAEDPGNYGNPLFIYGGSGLGKTHLLHAIGHYVYNARPSSKIIYVQSEEFTNELVSAIQHGQAQTEKFKNKYRSIDMLLIDDIQFITNKESTQEEFFHTFNSLYEKKKQIVISSDKPPRDINGIEDRLITRFQAGLTVDVQAPNYETRMAILKKRAELDNIQVDDESLDYIASNIKSSIRELESSLSQVYNLSKLRKTSINYEVTKEALKDRISPEEKRVITAELIIRTVSEHFGITPSDIQGKKRSNDIAYPRQICMYLCRKLTSDSQQAVGEALGGKDHSTIIHGEKKIQSLLESDTQVRDTIDILIKKINPPA